MATTTVLGYMAEGVLIAAGMLLVGAGGTWAVIWLGDRILDHRDRRRRRRVRRVMRDSTHMDLIEWARKAS